jgi:vancomycin resistance protein YoaR
MMSRTFRGQGTGVPENPILNDAKAKADSGQKDLRIPDKPVGAPKEVLDSKSITPAQRKEVAKLEGQIKRNVEQQKAAIKAGDFTLVEALKDVYAVLKTKLEKLVKEIVESAKNPTIGMSIRKTVTPEKVAAKIDAKDVDNIRRFLNGERTKNITDMLDAMGVGKAKEDVQRRFVQDVLIEADRTPKLKKLLTG